MIKNIFISHSKNNTIFSECLDFNGIPYTNIDLWTYQFDKFGGYYIPDTLSKTENNLLVMDHRTFKNFFDWDIGIKSLIKFTEQNQIWLWNNIDGLICYIDYIELSDLCLVYSLINYKNILSFTDGQHINCKSLIRPVIAPVNHFMRMPRIELASVNKTQCHYDFLLTTIVKPGREHRSILIDSLNHRTNLKSTGLISDVHRPLELRNTGWLGKQSPYGQWHDGYPSMDLYKQCWFEIAPETMYQNGHFYTEKTNKPIATKTPFLTVSTKGYLGYLRSLGFKTFDSLINESYDQQDSIEDRVRLMLDQAEDIIANGSEQFYNAAKPILDHNYNYLAEITGKWDHLIDAFIIQQLERAGFKL